MCAQYVNDIEHRVSKYLYDLHLYFAKICNSDKKDYNSLNRPYTALKLSFHATFPNPDLNSIIATSTPKFP